MRIAAYFLLSLVVFIGCGLRNHAAETEGEAFAAWVKKRAIPIKTVEPGEGFEDLAPIKKCIGSARLVCIGESRHDAHEHFRFKHRMIEFLVEEMGFTLFAMEESLPCCGPINEYILRGVGNPEALLNSVGGWFLWDTKELLALIKWMRSYNQSPQHKKKVRFYGIDIADPLPGIQNVLAYLKRVDPSFAASLEKEGIGLKLFSKDMWSETMENYRRLSAEDLGALGKRFKGIVERFQAKRTGYTDKSSAAEYSWVLRQVWVAKQAHDLFAAGAHGSFEEAGMVREKAMAENIRWLLHDEKKGERAIVWAHNFHVTRSPMDLNIPERPPAKGMVSMTQYLSNELGTNMVTIGCSFNRGEYPEGPLPTAGKRTVDGLLASAGIPLFLIDLRSAPPEGPVHNWLHRKQTMRGQGGTAGLIPGKAFDLLFFTEKITRTVPTPGARARFNSLTKK